jgi:ankyrin repeat protein
VQILIAHGADVHARSAAGFTPLLFAARNGDLVTTTALLGAGVSVNEQTPDGMTALLIATMRGHTRYGAFLLDRGADPNRGPGYVPLHWAAGEWPTELTGATTGILADNTEWSALGGLKGEAKIEWVTLLLDRGADPNARVVTSPPAGRDLIGATPFFIAAKAGDASVMRLLAARGANPQVITTRNTTALMAASGRGQAGRSWVTETSALEAVKVVLEMGADIHAVDADGETALHVAASRGWDTVVQLLVDNGASLNVKNKRGWTPLTIAEGVHVGNFYAHPSTADLLRKLGADPSPPDINRGEP